MNILEIFEIIIFDDVQNVANWNGNIFLGLATFFLGFWFFQFGNILVPDLQF